MNQKSTSKIIAPNKTYRGGFNVAVEVFDSGYRWEVNLIYDSPLSRFIEPEDPVEPPWIVANHESSSHLYYPFCFPDLHRKFAGLDIEEEAILKFANEFGFLNRPYPLQDPTKEFNRKFELRDLMVEGESFYFWEREIQGIKNLLCLWELVKNADQVKIDKELEFNFSAHEFCWKKKPYEGRFSLYEDDDEFVASLLPKHTNDKIDLVRKYLLKKINRKMAGHGSPELVLEKDKDEIKFHLYTTPNCLLSSIYVLFAQEIQGFDFYQFKRTPPFEFCELCKKLIEPISEKRKYCSNKCRILAGYRRNAEAINAKKREKRKQAPKFKKIES